MPKEWYIQTPKRFSTGQIEYVMDSATESFADYLEMSPESEVVTINGVEARIVVQSKSSMQSKSTRVANDTKQIRGIIDSFDIGDLIVRKKLLWLVTTFVDDNTMHSYGDMEMCKTNLVIDGKPIKEKIGNDPSGKPIYQTKPSETFSYPCVVISDLQSNPKEQSINLPNGTILIKIQYVENASLEVNAVFKLFSNQQYKIVDIDVSNTYEKEGIRKGIIGILASRVQQG